MDSLADKLRRIYVRAASALRTTKGRNVLLYLLFVCVAFVFWLLMSLDSEVQRNYDVPLQIENLPDSVVVIHDLPPYISTTVQGKGSQLIRFAWGKPSPMKIQYEPSAVDHGVFEIPSQKVLTRLRDYFGGAVQIISARPDSLSLTFTTSPGKRVPLRVVADIETDLQSIASGDPVANVDSVTIYSVGRIPSSIQYVSTEELVRTGLKDTSRFDVKVIAPEGMRVVPDHVIVTVPVEPLVSKKRKVELSAVDLPADTRMLLFPSSVEVTYLVPMSKYKEDYPIRAYVSYREAQRSQSAKVAVQLGPLSGRYYSLTHNPDSVEFIIEHTGH